MKASVKRQGFTLVELLVTVAVVAILAAIALPAYQSYLVKGRRAEARAALMELMQQQERYATQRNTYLELSLGQTGTVFKTWSGDGGLAHAHYTLSAEACPDKAAIAACVKLRAVPQKEDAQAGTLTYDSLGNKSCTGTHKALCWQ